MYFISTVFVSLKAFSYLIMARLHFIISPHWPSLDVKEYHLQRAGSESGLDVQGL